MPEPLPTWNTSEIPHLDRFAHVRLIALDVDGTLLRDSTDNVATVVRSLHRKLKYVGKGIRVTIATGRALAGAADLAQSLNPGGEVPIVIYNGALVAWPKKRLCLYHQTISDIAARAVLDIAKTYDLPALAYTVDQNSLGFESEPLAETVYGWCKKAPSEHHEFNGLPVRWMKDLAELVGNATTAILLDCGSRPSAQEVQGRIALVPGVSPTLGGTSSLEIRPYGANKGVALEYLARRIGIDREQVLAVGDSENDVEMLRWAGIGVAVASGSPLAIATSEFLCHHGAMSAVIEVLRLVRQAKRLARGIPLAEMNSRYTHG
jgi:Cof subfamily protein (haloacid dehalogenase superfamily)